MRFLLLLLPLSLGCPMPDDCTPLDTRCLGGNAQICGSDQRWRTFVKCPTLGENWVCCWSEGIEEVPSGHSCFMPDQCEVPDADP